MKTDLYNSSFPNFSLKKRSRMLSNKVNEKRFNDQHGDGAPPKKRRFRAQSSCISKKRVTFSSNLVTFHSDFLPSEAPARMISRACVRKSSNCPRELATAERATKVDSSTCVKKASGDTHLASPALSPSSFSLLRQSLENDIKCLETVLLYFSTRKGIQSPFQHPAPHHFKHHHGRRHVMDYDQQKMVVKRAFAVLRPSDKMIHRRLNSDETDALLQLTNMRYLSNHRC
eukprot:506899_1